MRPVDASEGHPQEPADIARGQRWWRSGFPAILTERGLLPEGLLSVYATGSVVKGWGNGRSDVDLYAVTRDLFRPMDSNLVPVALSPNAVAVVSFVADGQNWEVEYWQESQVRELLEKLAAASPGDPGLITALERDFLERVLHGDPLVGHQWLRTVRAQVEQSSFVPVLVSHALRVAASFREDALGMLEAGDEDSAVLAAHLVLTHTVDALLTSAGSLARNSKWHARRFRDVGDQAVLSYERYWRLETMQDYKPDRPGHWAETVLTTCEEIGRDVSGRVYGRGDGAC